MKLELNDIVYGNPTTGQYISMNTASYLDAIFENAVVLGSPVNDSPETLEELNKLVELTHLFDVNPDLRTKYIRYDTDMLQFFKTSIPDSLKQDVGEKSVSVLINMFDAIADDITPLINRIKFHFQRPRPAQLAPYYHMALYPTDSVSSDSPSFPSAHACLAEVLCSVIAIHYPRLASPYRELCIDFNYSRLLMGLHYESDVKAGHWLGQRILEDIEFKRKYKL